MADERDSKPGRGQQLELPLGAEPRRPAPPPPVSAPAARSFRIIRGEGKRRDETLRSRDDVARLLVSSAADMLLKRISADRAHDIQVRVDKVLRLFERCDKQPLLMPILRRELDELERVWRDGQKR